MYMKTLSCYSYSRSENIRKEKIAKLEAERKEELAYARLEGLRIQLYQQAEDERQRLNKEKQQIQDNLQAQQ